MESALLAANEINDAWHAHVEGKTEMPDCQAMAEITKWRMEHPEKRQPGAMRF